ncbi:VWA domain-containing protein [Neisseriaceae bacterium JH1-16]|nr:VWA domain-containing protein [Neisseriaceae bacterium JH1-16]
MYLQRKKLATITLSALLVSACGGGGSSETSQTSSNSGSSPASAKQAVAGRLVAPENTATTSSRILLQEQRRLSGIQALIQTCQDVPSGYVPLSGVTVEFKDNTGKTVDTLTSGSCGEFSGNVAGSSAQANLTTHQPLVLDFTALSKAGSSKSAPVVASALPLNASYLISSVQYLGQGQIAYSVVDSVSRKAVIGLNAQHLAVSDNSNVSYTPTIQGSSASVAAPTAIALVLDASGSMSTSHLAANGVIRSSFELASLATHNFLDEVEQRAAGDQVSMVVFDHKVTEINQPWLDKQFPMLNNNGNPVKAGLPASGLTSNVTALHLVADLYVPTSQLYGKISYPYSPFAPNPKTPATSAGGSYPWNGSTAFFDATAKGLEQLSNVSGRKMVISMTDGFENSSSKYPTSNALIAYAKQQGIPVQTIGFGAASDVDEKSMKEIASQTGGEYQRVENEQITGLYQNILTGIRFQYTAKLDKVPVSGVTLKLVVKSNGSVSPEKTLSIN